MVLVWGLQLGGVIGTTLALANIIGTYVSAWHGSASLRTALILLVNFLLLDIVTITGSIARSANLPVFSLLRGQF